jgi:hypothetical protein
VRYEGQAPLTGLDVARIKRAIRTSLAAQRGLSATVDCPAEVLQQAGLRFTCTAHARGRNYPFLVTETDQAGHVTYVGER